MTADLSALIARLEAAEVGSRELDAAVYDQLFPRLTRDGKAVAGFPGRWPFHPGSAHDEEVPPVTTSLDATITLAERALNSNVEWSISRSNSGGHQAAVLAALTGSGQADTPALSMCAALLRAKQGEG